MEEAAARIAQDNCELACCFIQKTAVEKAGPEMDKRLATVGKLKTNACLAYFSYTSYLVNSQEFELRKHARQEGRRYCDPVVLTYQAERMPEQIRLKVVNTSVFNQSCKSFVNKHISVIFYRWVE